MRHNTLLAATTATCLSLLSTVAQADVIFEPEPVESGGFNAILVVTVVAVAVAAAMLIVRGRRK